MQTLQKYLLDLATQAIWAACGEHINPEITVSTHAHYQCNDALKLAKTLKCNPRELAQKIIEHFDTENIAKIEIAGPGFINITLSSSFLSSQLTQQMKDPLLGAPKADHPMRIIVEFSSPNIAKELHVGHLRSTIIGDALARLFEFLGHDVLRLNHVGDWGTQFGMLISYMKEYATDALTGTAEAQLPQLMEWYRAAKKCFDENPDFKKRAQEEVVALQGGDPNSLKAWRTICAISRQAFEEIYTLLDVKLIERGESFYNPHLSNVVADLEAKGMVTVSDGAKCIFLDGFKGSDGKPFPMIIQKSDGGFNYSTTDMATMRQRVQDEKADRIIVVTDNGQKQHFQMVEAAAKKAGYLNQQFEHVTFGVVLSSTGKKFKTREGSTEKLIDLLNTAIERAEEIFQERLPDLEPQERHQMATILGIDAVKYADLSCLRTKDYTFSYDRMLKFEGNTAAFLLYAYVRIQGIKRRINKPIRPMIQLEHPSEIFLGLHLRRFGETLESMSRELLPNRLTDYLYELAEKFHAFFRDCHVEGSPQESERLALCECTGQILACGLNILGLKTLEKM
ncbi:MAG: arginine--tRNA ligase [Chlamydiales bacterium]|nr:arginine--tRNA ligase [Chlamydiales bacterium]